MSDSPIFISDEDWFNLFDSNIESIKPILKETELNKIMEFRNNHKRINIVSIFVDIWLKEPETIMFLNEPGGDFEKKKALEALCELIDN